MTRYLTTTIAAEKADVNPQTINYWLHRYPGLGYKVGGRWRLNPDYLQRILDGNAPLSRGR